MAKRLRPESWPPGEPGQTFRDDRLIWLAARPEMERIGRPWWLALFAAGNRGMRSSRQAHDLKKELGSMRMKRLAFACDEIGRKLTPEELALVRSTGELPEWFYPQVKTASKTYKMGH